MTIRFRKRFLCVSVGTLPIPISLSSGLRRAYVWRRFLCRTATAELQTKPKLCREPIGAGRPFFRAQDLHRRRRRATYSHRAENLASGRCAVTGTIAFCSALRCLNLCGRSCGARGALRRPCCQTPGGWLERRNSRFRSAPASLPYRSYQGWVGVCRRLRPAAPRVAVPRWIGHPVLECGGRKTLRRPRCARPDASVRMPCSEKRGFLAGAI